jgi:hypothetical protein
MCVAVLLPCGQSLEQEGIRVVCCLSENPKIAADLMGRGCLRERISCDALAP